MLTEVVTIFGCRFTPSDIEKICTSAKNLSLQRLLKQNPFKTCGNDAEGEISNDNDGCVCCTPILLYDDVLQAVREAKPSVDPKEVTELNKFAEEKGCGKVSHNYDPPERRSCFDSFFAFCLVLWCGGPA